MRALNHAKSLTQNSFCFAFLLSRLICQHILYGSTEEAGECQEKELGICAFVCFKQFFHPIRLHLHRCIGAARGGCWLELLHSCW